MIGIIDYGMGNLASVSNALKKLGFETVITDDADVLRSCGRLILPGVGAFPDCMRSIREHELIEPIKEMVSEGKPLLGICLGMQVLYESSEENGYCEGFGFLKGRVIRMEGEGLRVPQIGWNLLERETYHPVMDVLEEHPYVYYVHSYYVSDYDKEDLYGRSGYGELTIPGITGHANVLGTQFHPEKSGETGLRILKYFAEAEL